MKPSLFFAEKAIFFTVLFVLSMKRSVILCRAVFGCAAAGISLSCRSSLSSWIIVQISL